MIQEKAIGIDLGTTNSAAAWIDTSGRTAIIPNSEGELLTPSIVLFDDAEVVVGKEARSATAIHPDHVAQWVKRDMGSPAYSRPIRGKHLPPEVIQACILRKIRTDVTDAIGSDVKVVITVPAYFDEPRRKATADAGEMAGFSVLDIVNEPTAAALAFSEITGYLSPSGIGEEITVLVYDLGGGTFDATLLRLAPGDIRTLATDGDVQLGGHDWDLRLVDYAAESFSQTHGVDPRNDPASVNRLHSRVEEAKHTLSARGRAAIQVEHDGRSSEVPITRQQFEQMTADLLERTAYTTRQLIRAANLQWAQVSRVLLVGGSTRMPMVSQMLSEMTGIAPDHTVNPDEAVARGAAVYANHLLAEQFGEGKSDFRVINVNSHNLGVEGIEQETLRNINVVLIPRNTPLPAKFTERFITKSEGQHSIVVQVLEGESTLPGECTAIGRTVIRELPPGLPQGWPVEVTFEYATNGRLSVMAVVPGTHREQVLEIERDIGLSNEGISRWRRTVATSSGFDAFETILDEVLDLGGSASQGSSPQFEPVPDPGDPPSGLGNPPSETRPSAGALQSFLPGEERGAKTVVAGPRPLGEQAPAAGAGSSPDVTESPTPPPIARSAEEETPVDAPPRKPIPRWLINLVGFVSSAIVGLGLGYLIVSWLMPESGLPRLW